MHVLCGPEMDSMEGGVAMGYLEKGIREEDYMDRGGDQKEIKCK